MDLERAFLARHKMQAAGHACLTLIMATEESNAQAAAVLIDSIASSSATF